MMTKLLKHLPELEKARLSIRLFDIYFEIHQAVEKFKEVIQEYDIDMKKVGEKFENNPTKLFNALKSNYYGRKK